MTDLGTLDGNSSRAYGINDNGQVVGYSDTATSGYFHAFVTDASGQMTDLGTLGGNSSYAYGINNNGQVVGEATSSSGPVHAFVSDGTSGSMIDLGTLGGNYSYALGINDSGQVVGYATTDSSNYYSHAFVSDGSGSMTDLGTFGGNYSYAQAINDSGQVVGYAYTSSGFSHAFVSDGTPGSMTDLGTLGGNLSFAYGINDSGLIVGNSGSLGFLYDPTTTTMTDLNNLIDPASGWTITDARAINASGQIAANGYNPQYGRQALLLTPTADPVEDPTAVPEPSGLALAGAAGVVGLGLALRRRAARSTALAS
jgi:probable HAF family extracellular repeat protein